MQRILTATSNTRRNTHKEHQSSVEDDRSQASREPKQKVKPKLYGVLGVDSIVDKELERSMSLAQKTKSQAQATKKNYLHAFNLEDSLFTPRQQREDQLQRFEKKIKSIDKEIRKDSKRAEALRIEREWKTDLLNTNWETSNKRDNTLSRDSSAGDIGIRGSARRRIEDITTEDRRSSK